jgi:phosphoadenosine phosphosulfate reductase
MAEMLDYYVEQGAGIDLIVAPLLRLAPRTVRHCLEIGGSFGFALDFCRYAFGWEVLEVDPSPLAAAGAEALGLPLRRAYFSAGLDLGPEPFEAVILHMAARAQSGIPVLWVDHGTNLPETYRFAEKCRTTLDLNLKPFLPTMTAAHWLALNGGQVPMPDEVERVESFSRIMKLEPFERGMRELAPTVWITALRKVQNAGRANLDIVSHDVNFGTLKVSPVFHLTDAAMESYLEQHQLPNEWDYFDPAKADEKRECGLHAAWGGKALAQ